MMRSPSSETVEWVGSGAQCQCSGGAPRAEQRRRRREPRAAHTTRLNDEILADTAGLIQSVKSKLCFGVI